MMGELIIIGVIIVVTVFIHTLLKHKVSDNLLTAITFSSIALLIVGGIYTNNWGTKKYGEQIGSLFEKTTFSSMKTYYAYVSPTKDESKRYKIKASITKSDGYYQLYAINWPNGGESIFENYGGKIPLVIDERVLITDDSNKSWWIELTSEES